MSVLSEKDIQSIKDLYSPLARYFSQSLNDAFYSCFHRDRSDSDVISYQEIDGSFVVSSNNIPFASVSQSGIINPIL